MRRIRLIDGTYLTYYFIIHATILHNAFTRIYTYRALKEKNSVSEK